MAWATGNESTESKSRPGAARREELESDLDALWHAFWDTCVDFLMSDIHGMLLCCVAFL